jgi:hypothetical protein
MGPGVTHAPEIRREDPVPGNLGGSDSLPPRLFGHEQCLDHPPVLRRHHQVLSGLLDLARGHCQQPDHLPRKEILAGTGRGGARIPSSGSRRSYRGTAHDSAERRTAHRPQTTATDAPRPAPRQRANAPSNCAGHKPARPSPAS